MAQNKNNARAKASELTHLLCPKDILINAGALRQLKHNNNSDGFVYAYDRAETEKVVKDLLNRINELEKGA